MGTTIGEIVPLLETLAPPDLAEEWDNVGLQLGHHAWLIETVQVALDPTPEVVQHACRNSVDLLITHHPLIFRPLKALDLATPLGTVIEMAVANKLGIYAAHTNLDSVTGGINDVLATRIGLKEITALFPGPAAMPNTCLSGSNGESASPTPRPQGLGRVGRIDQPLSLRALGEKIKDSMGLDVLKVCGQPNMLVKRVAVCGGSGSSLLKAFYASGAEVFVSGDLRYHDARDVEAHGYGLIDIGHFASEHIILDVLARRVAKLVRTAGLNITVDVCRIEKDPFYPV